MLLRARHAVAVALAIAAASARSQDSPTQLVAALRDPAGRPVADAEVGLAIAPAGLPTALAWFAARGFAGDTALRAALPPQASLSLRSDARGMAMATVPDSDGAACASGVVTSGSGLGALIAGLRSGRAQRIDLQPMAALAADGDDGPLRVHTRVRTPNGVVVLGPLVGATVRLPAGDHEAWIRTRSGWRWRRLALAPGQTATVEAGGPRRVVLRPAPGWQLLPDGRPDVALFADGEDAVTLCGDAAAATFVAWSPALGALQSARAVPNGDAAVRWPLDAATAVDVDGLAPAPVGGGEALALVLRQASGEWQPLACATRRSGDGARGGAFALPAPPPGDCWLVHLRTGAAPIAAPYRVRGAALADGVDLPLRVRVRDERGEPVADAALAYEPEGMPAAAVSATSDEVGRARLGRARGPGALRLVDPRFANQTVPLATAPGDEVALTASPGAALRGALAWPDGAPSRGVVVTLRDPTGALAPAERSATTDASGGFAFAGLQEGRGYVLFATARRDGRTWSARGEARAGAAGTVALVVRDEDPAFAPPRR